MTKFTRAQAAIAGAYTGFTFGPFEDIHEYAEKRLGRPIFTHQFAEKSLMAELTAAAEADFLALCADRSDPKLPGAVRGQERPQVLTKDQEYAVRSQLGNAQDNLHRAKAAARSNDASKQWGQSGKTLAQIVSEYEAEVARWKAALE